jgi:hypothetical protein
MRIECQTCDEFMANLKDVPAADILLQTVYVSMTERPLDTSDKRQAVSFSITVHASAVVNLADGGQYMVDYGEDCGLDYRDASKELVGTQTAGRIREKLVSFCDDHGLRVRPGIVQI